MVEWFDEPCSFQLKETENGLYYQGVGTGDKYEEIQAAELRLLIKQLLMRI